jgi:hypothetical protein
MIVIAAKGYDSLRDVVLCDWCMGAIKPMQTRIIYGTGNSLLSAYHPLCDALRIKQSHGYLSGEGPLAEETAISEPQIRDD